MRVRAPFRITLIQQFPLRLYGHLWAVYCTDWTGRFWETCCGTVTRRIAPKGNRHAS